MKPLIYFAVAALGFWFLTTLGDEGKIKKKKADEQQGRDL